MYHNGYKLNALGLKQNKSQTILQISKQLFKDYILLVQKTMWYINIINIFFKKKGNESYK